ncbi:AAA family ATPase [Methylobacterium sp. CM6247]
MNDLTPTLDPKYAHLPLYTQRLILAHRLECEEEEREERRCQERIAQKRAEMAAKRAAEAAQKEAFEARRQAHVNRDTPFVMTSAARVVLDTIDRCVRFGHNGLVTGAPGVGKTRALEEAVRRSGTMEGPPVGLVTVTGVMGNSTMAVLEEIAPHVGVRTVYSVTATMKLLCSRASEFPVLLFDEAQNLADRVARDLLAISEQAHVQMLFLGNDEVLKFVNSQKAAIRQIARRLPIREEIDCILDADADLLAGQYAVEDPEALRLCRTLAETHHADGIGKVLPIACAVAEAAGSRTVNVDHLREALSLFPHFSRDLARAKAGPQVERQSSFKRLPKRR